MKLLTGEQQRQRQGGRQHRDSAKPAGALAHFGSVDPLLGRARRNNQDSVRGCFTQPPGLGFFAARLMTALGL